MRGKRGITLVSLVVTIVVLIILAGVSINLVLGENGIITIARQAKENMELAQIEEEEQLNELYSQMSGTSDSLGSYDEIEKLIEFKREIASAITDMGVATSEEADSNTMATNIRNILNNAKASSISYDNTNSGLDNTNVQGAIDELNSDISMINNNLTKIGNYYEDDTTAQVNNETFTPIASVTLSEKGTYLLTGRIRYESNNNGIRGISLHLTSGWNSFHNVVDAMSSPTVKTIVEHSRIVIINEPATIYLNAYQDSGSTLNCDVANITCVKLST